MRDHYPLPFIEHVLKRVVAHEAYSFVDGFSWYNQVSIDPKDQHKIAFATTSSVFTYRKNAIWVNQCPSNFSKTNGHSLQGILAYMARDLSQEFMRVLMMA